MNAPQTKAGERHPWIWDYVVTAGRTFTAHPLHVHTPVATRYDAVYAAVLPEQARRLYQRAAQVTESVAELSANTGVSLAVTRVLLGDLADNGKLIINPVAAQYDRGILERVIHGLREL